MKEKKVIGMIHLPHTVSYEKWNGLRSFVEKAKFDLKALQTGGVDMALIENDADSPCQVKGTADVVSPMSIVAYELANIAKIPLGIEVLLNDPEASLAIAKTCGLNFIRTDYFIDKMSRQNYGEFEINPRKIMEYRSKIKGNDIQIYTDIQVKYATMLDQGKTIRMSVVEAIENNSNGIVVTGKETGISPIIDDVKEANKAANGRVPVIVGSGFSFENAKELFEYADWAIVGSSIKTNGLVDTKKVKKLMSQVIY